MKDRNNLKIGFIYGHILIIKLKIKFVLPIFFLDQNLQGVFLSLCVPRDGLLIYGLRHLEKVGLARRREVNISHSIKGFGPGILGSFYLFLYVSPQT